MFAINEAIDTLQNIGQKWNSISHSATSHYMNRNLTFFFCSYYEKDKRLTAWTQVRMSNESSKWFKYNTVCLAKKLWFDPETNGGETHDLPHSAQSH